MVVIDPADVRPCLRAYIASSACRSRSSGERPPSSSTTPTLAEIVFGATIGHGSARTAQIRSTSRPGFRLVTHASHEDDELVAAETGDQVLAADHPPQSSRDLDENLVADMVAEGVVDVLEVVEIDEREDGGLVRRARLFERVGERGAIQELGERVGRRFPGEAAFPDADLPFDRVSLGEDPAHDPERGGEKPDADRGDDV